MQNTTLRQSFIKTVIKTVLPIIDNMKKLESRLASIPNAILATKKSPKRFEVINEYLNIELREHPFHGFPNAFPGQTFTFGRMQYALRSLRSNPSQPKTQAPLDFIQQLESYARSLGVSSIGYAENPDDLIFQGKALLYKNMIVITMEMDQVAIAKAPSNATAIEVWRIYTRETRVVLKIAKFLRKNGYSAQACYPLLGLALYPALAQKAGLGWRGAHGLLITPEHGSRVRIGAVSTSIDNLPFSQKNENQWIESYCTKCRRCILECPAKAVYDTPISHSNGLVTCIDNRKCFPQFANNHSCAVCIRVCPFSSRDSALLKEHSDLSSEAV